MLKPFDRKTNKSQVTDSQGRNLTIALFFETNDARTDNKPIWSLKDWKEVYLHLCDPTEYSAAIYLIGDWKHWQQIADRSACSLIIKQWREELRVKLKSLAIENLKRMSSGPKGVAAAKWLAENGYDDAKTKRQLRQDAVETSEEKAILENAERLKSAV